ncbi:Palmitoyltransferase [Teratosphaeriaceae sp. CCFEE 6253]|nr:Palmitoyltransferase [Teratosphaeriaceae sp. CCFEE 6253]
MTLLLGRTLWCVGLNMTTIEGWEVERHHAVLRRARASGGLLYGPDGKQVRIEHQEFPWDIGIWTNICRGMGSRSPLVWVWPFARSPRIEASLDIEHNCIDDPSKPWPPLDPDRMFRAVRRPTPDDGSTLPMDMDSFYSRQAADMARYEDADGEYVVRRKPFHERAQASFEAGEGRVHEVDDDYAEVALVDDVDPAEDRPVTGHAGDDAGEEAWRNKEGERLADFGVDEVADFYDEDDMPLAQLLKRRKAREAS